MSTLLSITKTIIPQIVRSNYISSVFTKHFLFFIAIYCKYIRDKITLFQLPRHFRHREDELARKIPLALVDDGVGVGDYADSQLSEKIYNCELAVIGENSTIPDGVTIGKNVAISGKTEISDYPDGKLPSGGYIVKAGEI